MLYPRVAALLFAVVAAVVISFEIALACGAPWGFMAMGGANTGVLPPSLRVAAVVQAVLLASMTFVVLSRAGVVPPGPARWSTRLIWVVVAFAAVSVVLNAITPSETERSVWLPVAIVMLVSSLIVARTR